MWPNSWKDIKHFKPAEFACRCGECGSDGNEMNLDFVDSLDQLRERLGYPMTITSGYRCPAYNERISTTGKDGPHTTGRAADVLISGEQAFRLVQQCSLGGWMSGIGIKQKGPHEKRFIHLDDLAGPDHPRPRIWTY
jgi:uncharacterized protein YcbK (DUF882 family)